MSRRGKDHRRESRVAADSSLACIILAAGKGTRMRSAQAKVLHTLLGRPMVAYPIQQARDVGADPVVLVLGHQRAEVQAAVESRFGAGTVKVVEQAEQRGTGHAVRLALPALKGFEGTVLILYGDVPLLRRETISELVGVSRKYGCLAMVTATPPDPSGYGRVLRDERDQVLGIVEHRDASPEELAIGEVNAGIYAAPVDFFRTATARLRAANAQGEYYLTDIVRRAAESIGVGTVSADCREVGGINERSQLAEAEEMLRRRINGEWLRHVTFRDPSSAVVEPDVELGVDVVLGRNVSLRGKTVVGRGAIIEDGCVLQDTVIEAGAELKPYTIATQATVGAGCKVGPFAHLRPHSVLGPDVHVGNFVETKKTTLGRGAKANHLTYLGDATVGERVNVGAGTITCNYNGYEKRQTIIEDRAFIGSDTQLVAPVRVGSRAVVAAGTTVTDDVPEGALAISRVPQKIIEGYADKVARRYAANAKQQGNGKASSTRVVAKPASPAPRRARRRSRLTKRGRSA